MKTRKLLGIICLLAVSGLAEDLASSYREAAARGDAQEKATDTRDYFTHSLLPYYEKAYGPVLQACFRSVAQPDDSGFAFVAAIGADGRVMRLYTDHETNIFRCIREALNKDTFPKPPVVPYYLHIEMQLADDLALPASTDPAPPLLVRPDKYSYTFGVPRGWTFSFEQASARGAALAFFPQDGSFNYSSSVIYVNEIDDGCSSCMDVLSQRIASTIQLAKGDSPEVRVETDAPVITKDGGKAQIRLLKRAQDPRDPKGPPDDEALAFIGHHETVILVVLTVRDRNSWAEDYKVFREVVAGHKFFNCKSPELRVKCRE